MGTILQRYERFLRIDSTLSVGERLRARVIYIVAWAFIALQAVNWPVMYVAYGGWNVQHLISLLSIVGLIGITCALRVTRSQTVFGLVFGALLLLCIVLASVNAGNPLLGAYANTSLLPLLVVGPVLIALISNWRLVAAYTAAALAILVGFYLISASELAGLDAATLAAVPSTGALSGAESLALNINQRSFQTALALVVTSVTAGIFSYRFFGLLDELEQAAAIARDSESAKGDFLAKMSHEIRSPLNGIISMSELLLLQGIEGNARKQAEIISTSSTHLLDIVNDVLDTARLEAGRLDLHADPFDARATLQTIIRLNAQTAHDRGLWLGMEWMAGEESWVVGDEKRFRQIFTNLVSNALKFTEVGGVRLLARGHRKDGRLVLQVIVQDTGVGIEPEALSSIFERYGQSASGSRQGSQGTGLGLAIVRELVELMDGTISVQSTHDLGTVFLVDLKLEATDGPDEVEVRKVA